MVKKLFIFLGAAAAAAIVTGAVARRRAGDSQMPLLESSVNGSNKATAEWGAKDDVLSTEFASVVGDEVVSAR